MEQISETLRNRHSIHGNFSDNSRMSQVLKRLIRGEYNHDELSESLYIFRVGYNRLSPVQIEALDMIFHKISRILAGNPNHPDHWHDISGYATLAEERIGEKEKGEEKKFFETEDNIKIKI